MGSAALLVWPALLWASAAWQGPAFRAGTRLVEINVVVRDKNGPAANLRKDDFALSDRGKTRKIAFFTVNKTDLSAKNASLAANTFSNRGAAAASVTVILLDALNTLTGSGSQTYEEHPQWSEQLALANARQQLIRYVDTMGEQDRVAIYSLGRSLDVLSDFTGDREQLRSVLEKYQPVSLTRREDAEPLPVHLPGVAEQFNQAIDRDRLMFAGIVNQNRTQTTMMALSAIARHVTAIPGRKNLVWLTGGLPFPGAAAARVVSRADIAIYPVDARGLLAQNPPSDFAEAASRMYSHAGSRPLTQPPGLAPMEDMAWQTGGRAFINTNDLTSAIRSAIDDSEITYTLGFYLEEASLDGKFHQVKVRVKSAGYEVRAPRGYFADKDAAVNQSRLAEAIASPLGSAEVGLTARVDRTENGAVAITGAADLANLELAQAPNLHHGVMDVFVAQMDAEGKLLDLAEERYNLRLSDPEYASYLKPGILFRVKCKPRDKVATFRVVVTVAGGSRIGSLVIPASRISPGN